jgi:hypothetical protein
MLFPKFCFSSQSTFHDINAYRNATVFVAISIEACSSDILFV